jgi:hypothetical protein
MLDFISLVYWSISYFPMLVAETCKDYKDKLWWIFNCERLFILSCQICLAEMDVFVTKLHSYIDKLTQGERCGSYTAVILDAEIWPYHNNITARIRQYTVKIRHRIRYRTSNACCHDSPESYLIFIYYFLLNSVLRTIAEQTCVYKRTV